MLFRKKVNFAIATLLIVFSNVVFAQQVTKVIDLNPTLPTGAKVVSGNCWTNSIAVNRPDAWRCMVGNSIMDPCFTTPSKNKLVCNIDPVAGKPGVILNLTKPLPVLNIVRTTQVHPWIIKLADGSVCRPYTGTMPITDKGGVSFYCTSAKQKLAKNCYSGLIMDSVMEGKLWTAKKVVYCSSKTSKTGLVASRVDSINVTTVWR